MDVSLTNAEAGAAGAGGLAEYWDPTHKAPDGSEGKTDLILSVP